MVKPPIQAGGQSPGLNHEAVCLVQLSLMVRDQRRALSNDQTPAENHSSRFSHQERIFISLKSAIGFPHEIKFQHESFLQHASKSAFGFAKSGKRMLYGLVTYHRRSFAITPSERGVADSATASVATADTEQTTKGSLQSQL